MPPFLNTFISIITKWKSPGTKTPGTELEWPQERAQSDRKMLGTALPGFRNCNPSWLGLSRKTLGP